MEQMLNPYVASQSSKIDGDVFAKLAGSRDVVIQPVHGLTQYRLKRREHPNERQIIPKVTERVVFEDGGKL
jgi:hypothetical protein